MHNYIEGSSNTEFDKYNVPHRYYEYQVAQVVPILRRGHSFVLEDLLTRTSSGFVYDDVSELISATPEITFYKPTFAEYAKAIFGSGVNE